MDVKISLPLLPLRDIVVFPSMVIPLFVGRDKSISALNEVMKKDKKIILVTQKNSEIDDPSKTDVFMYGRDRGVPPFRLVYSQQVTPHPHKQYPMEYLQALTDSHKADVQTSPEPCPPL